MTANKLISRLWELGHFNNPAHPTGVTESAIGSLKLTDPEVKSAISSYQEFMGADFDRLSLKHHDRMGITDGEVGPATEELIDIPRCGMPDFGPDVEAATGTGSWKAGCLPEWPNNHAAIVKVDPSGMPSRWGNVGDPNSIFEKAFRLCQLAYADMGFVLERNDSIARPHMIMQWTRGRGWIGLAQVPGSFSCNSHHWSKYDTKYNPSDAVNQLARLFAHELGHNCGWGHTRGGILNPSIERGVFRPDAWRNDPNESRIVRAFGGEPVPLDGPDNPDQPDPEPPKPSEFWFKGEFTLMKGDEEKGVYHIRPKDFV